MTTSAAPPSPHVETHGNVTTVTLTASPVRDSDDVIARQLTAVPTSPAQHLLLDFTNVDYLNGVELGTLVALHTRVRGAGGRLTLFNMAPHLRELFTVTRLDTVMTVCQEGATEPRHPGMPGGMNPLNARRQ